ncbi:MAG: hypothetical protein ACREQ4_08345, partial [Candidatus Binataceae bacterium]
CILGGIKEVVGHPSRNCRRDINAVAEEILAFGLRGVARPELLEATGWSAEENSAGGIFLASKLD